MDLPPHNQIPEFESPPKPDKSEFDRTFEQKKQREESKEYCAFMEKLAQLSTPEEKIAHGLSFMRASISQEGSPHFREFWEARKVALPCFKESIDPSIRSKLWTEYVELTVEARRLKEILEEQSAFAMEQIDLAIAALESDVANFQAILGAGKSVEFPHAIQAKSLIYNQIQRELNLLNTLTSRLNGLRKEVIKTDMRVRFKTKFFKRLSDLADQIFPKRKHLIEEISNEFQKDIDQFVERHFKGDLIVGAPYFALREEIKALQRVAKLLTLSSYVFNRTRLMLSECWDKIRVLEKEHKKEINAKRQASQENRVELEQKLEQLEAKASQMTLPDLERALDEISQEMREVSLHRQDVIRLRDRLSSLRIAHLDAQAEKRKELEKAEKERLHLKRESVTKVKERIAQLLRDGLGMDHEILEEAVHELKNEIKELGANKIDQQQFDRSLRQLKDLVSERKAERLLHLNEDDRHALEHLQTLLEEKKKRRQEIKDQVEYYRRALGSSNLDFEKGMIYREQIEQEKELLDRVNQGIEEIEGKISELES